jgi:Ras-related protein Rab-11A
LYFNGSHAAILVYSINKRASFQNLDNWLEKISTVFVRYIEKRLHANGIIVLVGNKCDLIYREVSIE